jgi:hypothetical protein
MLVVMPKECLIRGIRCGGLGIQRVGGFCSGASPDRGTPEWKVFIKTAGFGRMVVGYLYDIQIVVFFGMFFGHLLSKK